MPLAPKAPKDLALAPVAAHVDGNLQRLRAVPLEQLDHELSFEADYPRVRDDRAERAERVLAYAIRNVDLHGWHAEVTDDGSAVRLSGGSVSLELAVGATVLAFIQERA